MKRIVFLAMGLLLLIGCSGKEQIAPEQQEHVVQCPTQTPLPNQSQTTPNSTPTPISTIAPTFTPEPTGIPVEISQVEKGSDDWYSVEYLYPQNGYEQIIKITFSNSATSVYLGFKNGSWVVITEEYG